MKLFVLSWPLLIVLALVIWVWRDVRRSRCWRGTRINPAPRTRKPDFTPPGQGRR